VSEQMRPSTGRANGIRQLLGSVAITLISVGMLLGSLLLIVFLGLIGLTVMMIYNLDAIRSAIVLCIVSTLSSLMYKMTEYSISIELTTNTSHV